MLENDLLLKNGDENFLRLLAGKTEIKEKDMKKVCVWK